MIPEEKAKQLIEEMKGGCCRCARDAQEAALTCCDEIIKELQSVEFNYDLKDRHPDTCLAETVIPYWQKVKQHVTSL